EVPPVRCKKSEHLNSIDYQQVACDWRVSALGLCTDATICDTNSVFEVDQSSRAALLRPRCASRVSPVRRTPKSAGMGRDDSEWPKTRSRMRSPVASR